MEIEIKQVNPSTAIIHFGQTIEEGAPVGEVELDIENQSQFVAKVNHLLEEKVYKLLVDMRLVSYIDSSGLWAIFESHKKAVQRSGELILISPVQDVRRVLDITKMSSKIRIFESEEEALRHL